MSFESVPELGAPSTQARPSSEDWSNDLIDQFGDELGDLRSEKLVALRDGRDVIDLSMFNPDLTPPRFLLDKLIEASSKPHHHRYAVSRGVRKLREAFAQKYQARFRADLDPEREVCACLGSKDALLQTLLAVTRPGDCVLGVSPVYPAYRTAAAIARVRLLTVPMDLEVSPPDFESRLLNTLALALERDSPRLVLLNFPHNPTGFTVSEEFWREVGALALRHRALVFNDFVYGELLYEGRSASSALSAPDAKRWCVESYSLSKGYSVPGWRVGALVGNSSVIRAVSQLKANSDFGIFLPVQLAAAAALEASADLPQAARGEYRLRASVLHGALSRLGFAVATPKAGGSIWARVPVGLSKAARSASASQPSARAAHAVCQFLLRKSGVVCAPGSYYFPLGGRTALEAPEDGAEFVRFALVASVERLREVGARVEELLGEV